MDTSLTDLKREAPTDARQVRSRKALSAALLLLLEEKPFDQITIRELTARAGTGYATFFRHFPTKEALLADVATEEIAALLERTIPILQSTNSWESTLAVCAFVDDHRALWTALLTGGAAGLVRAEFIRQARGLTQGKVRPRNDWLPEDLGVSHGTGSTFDVLAWWLGPGKDYSTEKIARVLHHMVIAPLIGEPAEQQPCA